MDLCHVSKATPQCPLSGARSGQHHFGLCTVVVAINERDTLYALFMLCAMFNARGLWGSWVLISFSYAKSLRASLLRFRGVSRAGLPTGSGWIKGGVHSKGSEFEGSWLTGRRWGSMISWSHRIQPVVFSVAGGADDNVLPSLGCLLVFRFPDLCMQRRTSGTGEVGLSCHSALG